MKISIITVCLNASAHIEKNLRSVANQSYHDFEQVIVDGNSTDRTLDIIKQFQQEGSPISVVSEPDDGIYDAMNKGIHRARGDILYFLNADDHLASDKVLENVASTFKQDPSLSIVYGDLIWTRLDRSFKIRQPEIVSKKLLMERHVFHQTIFTSKEVFELVGNFSTNYKIVSDYEWELRVFLKNHFKYRHIPQFVAEMGATGVSNTTSWERERIQVMKQYFSLWEILIYRILPNNQRRLKRIKTNLNEKIRFLRKG